MNGEGAEAGTRAVAWPAPWRAAAAALRVVSRGSLLWAAWALLTPAFRDITLSMLPDPEGLVAQLVQAVPVAELPPTNPLRQIRLFLAFFAAPELAAWCLARACAATARVEDGLLRIDQAGQAWEIPAASVAGVEWWKVPLPRPGVRLRLASGRFLEQGLELADPRALVTALAGAGSPPSVHDGSRGRLAAYLAALAATRRGWLDNPWLKFGLYSLVPTVPAHRLHQFITFGGWNGEYLTFGLEAFVSGFALWWASFVYWTIVLATAMRVAVEAFCLLAAVVAPASAPVARLWLERLQRFFYYAGIPTFLLIRFTA